MQNLKKLSIIGTRTNSLELVFDILLKEATQYDLLISGGHNTAIACDYLSTITGAETHTIEPNYKRYGKVAAAIRAKEVITQGDSVLAIWDFKSKGTKNEIEHAIKQGKSIILYDSTGKKVDNYFSQKNLF